MTITAAIVGYGNLGRSVEKLLATHHDFELLGIFSRRDTLDTDTPLFPAASAAEYAGKIDVLFLCLGSATDIPEQAADYARLFTTVDTYDNHKLIPEHRERMDAAAREGGNLAMISTGWDPGLFSINRTYGSAVYAKPQQHTFWGPGLSQGHSDAVRRVAGVVCGVQYTVPSEDAMERARRGETEGLSAAEAHERQVFVVPERDDDELKAQITKTIVEMPNYFAPYHTTVTFITEEEFQRDHQGMPHGGHVITTGELGESRATIQYTLELGRNPGFTAASMIAYGRAAARMAAQGRTGAVTVLEVAPYLLSPTPLDELVARDI